MRMEKNAEDLAAAARRTVTMVGEDRDSIVTVDPSQVDAAAIGAGLAAGSPLAGRIVGIKDLIDVAGLPTLCGSTLGDPTPKSTDAEVVTRLRRAGAIPAIKTVTHEFAYGPTGDVSATGPVSNPHDRTRMSGGSSAGSAALLAEGTIDLALGTDTGGSSRTPAAWCGVWGLRPTSGALSAEGSFPLAPTLDTIGPMASNLADLAALWRVLAVDAGKHLREVDDEGRGRNGEAGTRPLRIGALTGPGWGPWSEAVTSAFGTVRRALRAAGHTVADIAPDWTELTRELYPTIVSFEAFLIHRDDFDHHPDGFQTEVLGRIEVASHTTHADYDDAIAQMRRLRSNLDEVFERNDVLLCPTTPISAPLIGQRSGFECGYESVFDIALAYTTPFSVLGVPALSLPVLSRTEASWQGRAMPVGIQLVGRPGAEEQLLALASEVTVTS